MNVISFLIYCVIVTFTPGPTNIAILSIAHNFRIKETFKYICGAAAALGMLLVASVILNSVLVVIVPKILIAMQIMGSLYILYLSYQVFKMDVNGDTAKQTASFISGFLLQFINPKVWMFTMTVIPSYVMPYYKSSIALLIFVLFITIIAFSSLAAWAFFGTVFKGFFHKYQKPVNVMLSILLVYSALEVSGIIEILKR